MKLPQSLFALLGFALAAATSRADVYTIDAAAFAPGTDVSTRFPGVTLARVRNDSGSPRFLAPVATPVITGLCTVTGACRDFGGMRTVGATLDASTYRECFEMGRLGLPWTCDGYDLLQMTFATPTDFVEVQATWIAEAPAILAFDASGSLIAHCMNSGPGSVILAAGSPTGCLTATGVRAVSGGPNIGSVRLTSPTSSIARVVFGGHFGGSEILALQYSLPPCGTKRAPVWGALHRSPEQPAAGGGGCDSRATPG